MKKFNILIFLCFLLSSSLTLTSVNKETVGDTACSISDVSFDSEDDELDRLIEEAIESNAVSQDIEPPKHSKLKLICAKIGILFFLKPYIFVATKYQTTKKYISKYAKIIWEKVTGKKETNEQKQ